MIEASSMFAAVRSLVHGDDSQFPRLETIVDLAYTSQEPSDANHMLPGMPSIRERVAAVCGLAGRVVHEAFLFANRRKISGKVLLEHELAQSKLATLATLEAILALLFHGAITNERNEQAISEICRVSRKISATWLELGAGCAFAPESGGFPAHQLLLEQTNLLASTTHATNDQRF